MITNNILFAMNTVNDLSFGRKLFLTISMPYIFMIIFVSIFGIFLMKVLKKINMGQQVRDDGPKSHLEKSGTPTFGGLMFIIPLFLFGILFPILEINEFLRPEKGISHLALLGIFTFFIGAVGFIDDFIKVRIDKKGLSPRGKSVLLLLGISFFVVTYLYFSNSEIIFYIPFRSVLEGEGAVEVLGNWKLLYGALLIIVLYATTNSVNITDGVDGLATTITFIVAFVLGLFATTMWNDISRGGATFAFAVSAGCLVFFFFNKHPAKIFMGDTGSQGLGAAIGGICIVMGLFWIIIPLGIIYVIESLSVIIQVSYFKKTRKRIFKMAPLHHHFELGGWSEWKVLGVFTLITLSGALVSYLMLI